MTRALDILRIVLGVVLVITAFGYFTPFLVTFAPPHDFADPMAARLVGTLDASGLMAVGKFVQLAGGALLLVNRATPFALAALLPVGVCAAFIAVVLEGDVPLALAALGLLALTALLALAYLPYYAAMLGAGQLADGERAEPGAHYASLFVNPLSGAPAVAYLPAALVLAAAAAFYWHVVPGLNGTTGLAVLAFPALALAVGFVRSVRSN